MKRTTIEFIAGLFVLLGLVAIAFLAIRMAGSNVLYGETYTLQARFNNVSGLNVGGPVRIAGVPVGKVEAINLDRERFQAIVTFRLRKEIQLDDDTIASVRTSGLIGDKFLALLPGGSGFVLAEGDVIIDTESTVDLESLISRFAFGEVNDTIE
jgi:phospholipid/cholesterol/gamma-HCH transport system substrate-binding protein